MWKSNVPILIFGNSPWGHTSKFYKVFPVISAVMSDTNSPEIAHILQTRHSAAPPQDCSHVKMRQLQDLGSLGHLTSDQLTIP